MRVIRRVENNGAEEARDHGDGGGNAGRYGMDRVEVHPESDEVKETPERVSAPAVFLPMFFKSLLNGKGFPLF